MRPPCLDNKKPHSPRASRRPSISLLSVKLVLVFYCHESGHLISACPALKKKDQIKKEPSTVVLIQHGPAEKEPTPQPAMSKDIDEDFKPFASHGFMSLPGNGADRVPITILRDTRAKYSIARRGVLPFSDQGQICWCGALD